ncbi:hypothetical protein N9N28_15845 [Rubripirellula amarantea]|nr:hypothetical protein [Rubripirellula amarantea]
MNQLKREREAIKALQAERVIMLFDYQYAGHTEPPSPEWLRKWIGNELVTDVEMLSFTVIMLGGPVSENVNDDLLVHLRSLPGVKYLMLDGCQGITDQGLVHLKGMVDLEELILSQTKITGSGFDALRKLRNLKNLDLQSTPVVDSSLAKLVSHKQLEELWLTDTRITDEAVPYLTQLTELKQLDVALTEMTPDGVQQLRKALPNCEISDP